MAWSALQAAPTALKVVPGAAVAGLCKAGLLWPAPASAYDTANRAPTADVPADAGAEPGAVGLAAAAEALGAGDKYSADVGPAATKEAVQAEQLEALGNGTGDAGAPAAEEVAGGSGVALVPI